jgi:hypothetical protein
MQMHVEYAGQFPTSGFATTEATSTRSYFPEGSLSDSYFSSFGAISFRPSARFTAKMWVAQHRDILITDTTPGLISAVAILFRLSARKKHKTRYGWDDWFVVIAEIFYWGLISMHYASKILQLRAANGKLTSLLRY